MSGVHFDPPSPRRPTYDDKDTYDSVGVTRSTSVVQASLLIYFINYKRNKFNFNYFFQN